MSDISDMDTRPRKPSWGSAFHMLLNLPLAYRWSISRDAEGYLTTISDQTSLVDLAYYEDDMLTLSVLGALGQLKESLLRKE